MRTALVLGATGLIGGLLLDELLASNDYGRVTAITRKPFSRQADGLENRVMSLDDMADADDAFAVDDVFCCLGSTIRQAGSREAFRRVDFDYCVKAAQLAASRGAKQFLMVSAVNADPRGMSFYARVKGEAEQAVASAGVPSVVFMQPSLLRGARSEFRLGEELGQKAFALMTPLVGWTRASWLPVDASDVARAMAAAALAGAPAGVSRLRYADIIDYSAKLGG